MAGHKVYLAGPMTGYPDHNYPLFNENAARLRAWGWDVINPAESFGGDQTRPLKDYMRWDVAWLMEADGIALLEGWEQSEGARFEVLIAQKLGLPIYDARSMALINDSIPTVYTTLVPDEARVLDQLTAEAQANGEYDLEVIDGKLSIDGQGHLPISDGEYEVEGMYDTLKTTSHEIDETFVRLSRTEEAITYNEQPFDGPFADKTREWVKKLKEEETVLEEAQRLVYGDRQASYGHPYTDYQTTSRLWEAILELPEGTIGPHKAALMMALMKISRESRKHKRDNLVDTAGYAACADRIARRQAGEE